MNRRGIFIIVFGFRLNDDKGLSNILMSRLNVTIQLYRKKIVRKIIVAGGLTNKKARISEAEAMKRYLIQNGTNKKDILKEENLFDTIGHTYFIKQKILKPKKWKKLIVIASDFNLERVKFIFKKILGRGYKTKFIGTKAFDIKMFFYEKLGIEKDLFELTKAFFKRVKDGNDKQTKKLIKRIHPFYSESGLKKLIKLSDKELGVRFGLKKELITRIRNHAEMMEKIIND